MSDPSYALQVAIAGILTDPSPPLVPRVYDSVPKDPVFPYVTIGEGQVLGDDTEDCGEGSEVVVRVHAWSRAVGYPEVKRLAGAIRSSLIRATYTLTGFDVGVVEFVQMQFLRDPDGKTSHAVVEFRYLITHTS